jgi:hypothetical protein
MTADRRFTKRAKRPRARENVGPVTLSTVSINVHFSFSTSICFLLVPSENLRGTGCANELRKGLSQSTRRTPVLRRNMLAVKECCPRRACVDMMASPYGNAGKGGTTGNIAENVRQTAAMTRRRRLVSRAPHDVTQLLRAWSDGDKTALDQLVPLVESELRRLARACMSRAKRPHPQGDGAHQRGIPTVYRRWSGPLAGPRALHGHRRRRQSMEAMCRRLSILNVLSRNNEREHWQS